MSIKVAINGFGRIGRSFLRIAGERENIEVVAVNDLMDLKTRCHLFKYDSNYGVYSKPVVLEEEYLSFNGHKILNLQEKDPAKLPWKDLGVNVVIESTGFFRTQEAALKHIEAGAKKVLISAPAKSPIDLTVVMGVNHNLYNPNEHAILSNASCTTNCLAPVVKVLSESLGFVKGFMTTVHSYTGAQNLLDGPSSKDLRRARAAALSIIPTTTGAAQAVGKVLPKVDGKIDGVALRVPTPTVSLVDLTALVDKNTSVEAVNNIFRQASQTDNWKGILGVSEEPLVSIDYKGNPHSSVVDLLVTRVIEDNLVNIKAWYDNEWGYSTRLVDLVEFIVR